MQNRAIQTYARHLVWEKEMSHEAENKSMPFLGLLKAQTASTATRSYLYDTH